MKTILIVEDNHEIADVYKRALKGEGYEVFSVNNIPSAEEQLEQKVDLVLLDIMLVGGKNGFDLLEKMKKNPALQNIPVVVITNLSEEKKTAMEIGADDYLVKTSTSLDEVIDKVKKLI